MIQSMFILSPTGEVLIERHFRDAPVSRSVCDVFWEKASKGVNHHGGLSTTTSLLTNEEQQLLLPLNVLPVMEVPETNHGTVYVISILRDGMSYLAVVPQEVSPLMILEFLHRVADIFVDYFGEPADESAIKENFSTVYQLLEEMVDYGWPLTTEPNALKAMIRPPSIMTKISSAMFSSTTATISHALPSGTISNMPWRAAGVTYTQNEIYMDIIEEIDAIIDAASGNIVQSDVSGRIQCQCQLSGIPDLMLTFKNPKLIDDCSFHPCVRYGRYERDQVVSFVPPDGNFELMKYSISADQKQNFSPPLECHSQWNVFKPTNNSTSGDADYSARLMVTVRVRSLSSLITSASRNSSARMMVEDVAVTIPFPKQVRTATFQVSNGSIVYDEAGKVAKWTLGKLMDDPTLPRVQLVANLKMNPPKRQQPQYTNQDGGSDDEAEKEEVRSPNLSLHWKIPLTSVSGLTVSGLSIAGESYQPYKGVRNVTKSGLYQVRYS